MFRSHLLNKRFFFTQPSLAFFDGTQFKPRRSVRLTPQNFTAEIEANLKDDWVIVPQPRPPSSSTFLIVTKKGNKVVGRIRPPLCTPFPRKYSGFEKAVAADDATSSETSKSIDTRMTKQDILDFYQNHPGNGNTWVFICTDRAVATTVINKMGYVEGEIVNFSLLCKPDLQNNRSTSKSVLGVGNGEGGVSLASRLEQHNNNTGSSSQLNIANDYDSPGFVRPGHEAPIWQELQTWINQNFDENLSQCCNWYARRDDATNNSMWEQVRAMLRHVGREERYQKNLKRAEEAYLEANGGAVPPAAAETNNNEDGGETVKQQQPTVSEATLRQTYIIDEEDIATATGGHEAGSKEALLYQSQLAVERRGILDEPKWMIIPPSLMPYQEYTPGKNSREQDKIKVISAVGRMRFGKLEFL